MRNGGEGSKSDKREEREILQTLICPHTPSPYSTDPPISNHPSIERKQYIACLVITTNEMNTIKAWFLERTDEVKEDAYSRTRLVKKKD